jgi:hypothetical protein
VPNLYTFESVPSRRFQADPALEVDIEQLAEVAGLLMDELARLQGGGLKRGSRARPPGASPGKGEVSEGNSL